MKHIRATVFFILFCFASVLSWAQVPTQHAFNGTFNIITYQTSGSVGDFEVTGFFNDYKNDYTEAGISANMILWDNLGNRFVIDSVSHGSTTILFVSDLNSYGMVETGMGAIIDEANGCAFFVAGVSDQLNNRIGEHTAQICGGGGSGVIDSTRLVSDSILVYYQSGAEIGRDTVRLAGTGGLGDNWGSQVVQSDATLSGDGTSGNPLTIAQQGATSGQVLKWNGTTWLPQNDNFEANTDNQTLSNSVTGTSNTISISNGNSIVVDVADNDNSSTNELQTLSTDGTAGNVSISNGNTVSINVNDADASSTNEIQDISTDGTAGNISISLGSTIVLNVDDADADPTNENQTVSAGFGVNVTQVSQDFNVSVDTLFIATPYDVSTAKIDSSYVRNDSVFVREHGVEFYTGRATTGSGGDNWGTQVVQSDATLSGTGIVGDELGIAQQGAASGQVLKWNGTTWLPASDEVNDADADPNNEIQTLSVTSSGDNRNLTISGGNTVTINVADNDNSTTNEIQDVDVFNYNTSTQNLEISLDQVANITTTSLASLEESQAIIDTASAIRASIPQVISDLDDVNSSGATNGQVLKWNGTTWLPQNDDVGSGMTSFNFGDGINNTNITDGETINVKGGANGVDAALSGNDVEVLLDFTELFDATSVATTFEFAGIDMSTGIEQRVSDDEVLTWINSNITGDNWGSQVVQSDATLSGDGTSGNPLTVAQQGATSGQVLKWNGTTWLPQNDDFEANTDNQTLSVGSSGTNRTITISGGNSVSLDVADNDNSSTNELQTISTNGAAGNISISNGNTVTLNVDDADADSGNELNTAFAFTGDTLNITDAGGTLSADLTEYRTHKSRISILTYGNSLTLGLEDSTDIGYSLLPNLLSYNNDIWNWEQAIPDTNLVNTGYTNIPRRTIGMQAGSGLTTERLPRHGNPGYWLAFNIAKRFPNDTVYLHQVGKGGIYTDSLVTSFYRDSLKVELDSALADGVGYYDVVIFPMTQGETADQYQTLVQQFYFWLRDTVNVIDNKTLFLIQGQGSQPEDNGIASSFEEWRPNWRYIHGMEDLPLFDGVHQTAQAHKEAGSLAYGIFQAGSSQVVRDSLMNISFGSYDIRHKGSENNFTVLPNNPGDLIDSLKNNIILAAGAGIGLQTYVRNNVIAVSNQQQFGMNNVSNNVLFGVGIMDGVASIRDSVTLVGRALSATKNDVVGIGHRSTINKVGGYVFGNDRTTTRNYQMLLGDDLTDYVVIGPVEFDMSFAPLTSSEEDYVFAWDNASQMFTLQAQTGSGGDNWGSQVVQTDATLSGDGTASNPLTIAQQGATNGQVLKWNGTTWAPAADDAGSGGDNLGNHIATQDLDMGDQHDLINLDSLTWNQPGGPNANAVYQYVENIGGKPEWVVNQNFYVGRELRVGQFITFNDAYSFPDTIGTNNQVLVSNGVDNLLWQDVPGDNLGNHIATQDLDMASFYINNIGAAEFNDWNSDGKKWNIYEKGVNFGDYAAGSLWFQLTGSTSPLMVLEPDGTLNLQNTPATNNSNNNVLVYNTTTKAFEINTSIAGGGSSGPTYNGPNNPGPVSATTTYTEVWRDTIPANTFTGNGKQWYSAKLLCKANNASGNEFLYSEIDIINNSTTYNIPGSGHFDRMAAGDTHVGDVNITITTDPDNSNNLIVSCNQLFSSYTGAFGANTAISNTSGEIIVVYKIKWSNADGDTFDVISDWSVIRQ